MNQMTATKQFIIKALSLIEEHSNETIIRDNFTSYLRYMFPDNPKWVDYHIQGAETHVHLIRNNRQISGFIDNCIDSIAIEYEKNLNINAVFEEGYRQVKEYCAALVREDVPLEMILGILSDTLHWRVYEIIPDETLRNQDYSQENIRLTEIASLDIDECNERNCRDLLRFLQTYLGRQGGRRITAKRIAEDFGLKSVYSDKYRNAVAQFVTEKADENPTYFHVIKDLWNKYVEGHSTNTDNIDSYISEYYISIIAKLLCANMISKEALSSDSNELYSIINGQFFENRNIGNFAEYDYFGWLNSNIDKLDITLKNIQDDFKVYDFKLLPDEDLFGELMVQLANKTHRLLLGQELTPRWLAQQLVSKVIEEMPQGEYPRFVDMCCGSGSMIVETIRATDSMLPRGIDTEERERVLLNCISGFDIDPLAVILAKINWLVNIYGIIKHDAPLFIPIYHADSLFFDNPMTEKDSGSENTILKLLDKSIVMPNYAISADSNNIFDVIVNKCYDCIHSIVEFDQFAEIIKESVGSLVDDNEKIEELSAFAYRLYYSLYQLNSEGKNGIWAFILKNSFRPSLISARYNGIVSNTPWLAMSKISSNPYKESLREIAGILGIKPLDASFPHLELATVFLLSSITRFLQEEGIFGCILPDSVLTGTQHDKLRNGDFRSNGVLADFEEIWELPIDTFKNRGIALFGRKRRFVTKQEYRGRHYDSKEVYESVPFHVLTTSTKVVWTIDNTESLVVKTEEYSFKQGADVMPRCFFFFTLTPQSHDSQVSTIKSNEEYSYFLKDLKIGRNLTYSCRHVPNHLFKSVVVSNILTPFTIGEMPLGLLPIKKSNGIWKAFEEADYLSCPRSTINLLKEIERDYWNIKHKPNMFDSTLNMRNKLEQQVFTKGDYLVVYGASGENVCAAYMFIENPDSIIVDQTLYWALVNTENEALFLTALLNCPTLNEIISSFQPQGIYGKRHIHTLPLHYIPRFDNNNDDHLSLVRTTRDLIIQMRSTNASEWTNPNKSTLANRRKRITLIMKELPSYAQYVALCERILKSSNQEEVEHIPFVEITNSEVMVSMAAEDIFVYGSIPVDLPKTNKNDLIDNKLDLVLMYAIGNPVARKKTEAAGKIALGIKEEVLSEIQKTSYDSVKYLMFHYWKDPKPFLLTKAPRLVDAEEVPTDFLVRQPNDAVKYLLLEYNPDEPYDMDNIDIMKTQRRGEIRYLPFVTTIESITKN